jgi:hypothetical protein
MATYKEIQGFAVQNFSQDPVPTVAGWTSGGNLNTTRRGLGNGPNGTQTAALGFGGITSTGIVNATEEYDGSSWTTVTSLSTARQSLGSAGTQTSALGFGGYVPPFSAATEEYDGSSWTGGGSMSTARFILGGAGTQTAGLAVGGYGPNYANATEEYDGSSWTAGGSLPAAIAGLTAMGIQTAALAVGGQVSGPTTVGTSYEYGGTSWTAGGTLNTARRYLAGAGLQTAGLVFAGGSWPPVTTETESYDGSTWTNAPRMALARSQPGGTGTQTTALAFGGANPYTNATEEYNEYSEPSTFQNDGQVFYNDTEKKFKLISLTSAAWASGTALPAARREMRGCGPSVNDGMVFGGSAPGTYTNLTQNYDGSSWTNGGNMGTARALSGAGTAAPTSAALVFGGEPQTGATEEYNGSSWTGGGTMNTARYTLGGAGTQTAGLGAGGYVNSGGVQTACEEYDGSSWTNVTAYPSAQNALSGCGPQTAALMGGGSFNEYDGSSWTAGGTPANPAGYKSVMGIQTNAVTVGGNPPSSAPTTEIYNGTSFSTSPATLPSGRYAMGDWGRADTAGVAGGNAPGNVTTVDEWDGGGATQTEDIDVT